MTDAIKEKEMKPKAYSWIKQDDDYNNGIVERYRCKDTVFLAYQISKGGLERPIDFTGEFQPLKNNYGIYFLIGHDKKNKNGGKIKIYVGQTSRGIARIGQHLSDKGKCWDEALFITSEKNDWSTGVLDTLENCFIAYFKHCDRFDCMNDRSGMNGNVVPEEYEQRIIAISYLFPKVNLPLDRDSIGNQLSNMVTDYYEDIKKLMDEQKKEIRDELRDELRREFENTFKGDMAKICWYNKAERYCKIKPCIEQAYKYILFGSILNSNGITEVVTPASVAADMVDMLPKEVFDSRHTFLDPACKSGIFLKTILDKLMSDDPNLPINKEEAFKDKRKRLDNIITNQLFGLAISEEGYMVSMKRLMDSVDKYVDDISGGQTNILSMNVTVPNIAFIKDQNMQYADLVKSSDKELLNMKINEHFFNSKEDKDVNFDVVIGNPPYQENTDGGAENSPRGMALFPYFIFYAQELGTYVDMVTPARWYSQPEGIFKKLRGAMLNGQLISLVDFRDSSKCFDEVNIAGGVSYWLWEKERENQPTSLRNGSETWSENLNVCDILLRDKAAYSIYGKILNVHGKEFKTFESTVSSTDRYGVLRKKTGKASRDADHNILLIHSRGREEFISQGDIGRNTYEAVNGYKLVTEYMNGQTDKVLRTLRILSPGEICDLSFIVIKASKDRQTIENCKSYFETKFVRFLIKTTITNTTVTRNNYHLVPEEAFDRQWTDQQLYEKYGLTDEEIACIEKTIKPMQ